MKTVDQQAAKLVEVAVRNARQVKMSPRPEGAAPVNSVELDIVWPDAWQGANQHLATHANLQRTTQEWAQKFGCRAKLLKKSGPGGGHPLFQFTGQEENLRRLVLAYCEGDADQAFYQLYGVDSAEHSATGWEAEFAAILKKQGIESYPGRIPLEQMQKNMSPQEAAKQFAAAQSSLPKWK